MTRVETITFAIDAGFNPMNSEEMDMFVAFAKLVAKHTLLNIDPSKFMSYQEGIEAGRFAEREACAKLCDLAMLQNQEAINELEEDEHIAQCFIQGAMTQLVKTSKAIRARGQA